MVKDLELRREIGPLIFFAKNAILMCPMFWTIRKGGLYSMDARRILAELLEEQAQINEAIELFKRLVAKGGRRRGRPPAWMAAIAAPKRRGQPSGKKSPKKKKKEAPSA